MTAAVRECLPNRRFCETHSFVYDNIKFHGTIGWFEPGRPAEVFLDGAKPGSALQAMARDAAVLTSLALQYGAPLATIRDALTRANDGTPAGPLGKLLDLVAEAST